MQSVTVNESYIKSVFLKVAHLNRETIVGLIYRPPNTDFHYLIYFFVNLPSLISVSSDAIICGKFNIDIMKIILSNDMASPFYNTMSSISLMPMITRPTRITGTSCTLIDNIFVSNYCKAKPRILNIDIADHLPIFIVYQSYFKSFYVSTQSVKFRVINDNTLNNFIVVSSL